VCLSFASAVRALSAAALGLLVLALRLTRFGLRARPREQASVTWNLHRIGYGWGEVAILAAPQVRDFSFSPDTGRIDALRYDALGLPAIPEAMLTVLEVGAGAVARAERGRITLRPGAELRAARVSEGLLGLAIDKARVRGPCKAGAGGGCVAQAGAAPQRGPAPAVRQ